MDVIIKKTVVVEETHDIPDYYDYDDTLRGRLVDFLNRVSRNRLMDDAFSQKPVG